MKRTRLIFILSISLLLIGSCDLIEEPQECTLIVMNNMILGLDYYDIDVYIDGTKQGKVTFNSTNSFFVTEGKHTLKINESPNQEGVFFNFSGTFTIYKGETIKVLVDRTGISNY